MSIELDEAIRPGDVHKFYITLEAITNRQSVDYLLGDNIFLHIKPLADSDCLVVNDFVDGAWRGEQRISIPDLGQRNGLDVSVHFAPLRTRISAGGAGSLLFERETPLLEVSSVRFPPSIVLSLSSEPLPPPPEELPRSAGAFWKRGRPRREESSTPPLFPGLSAVVTRADSQHVAGELEGETLPTGARLVATVDGRISGSLPAESLSIGKDGVSFAIVYDDHAAVAEGMIARVLVDHQGRQRELANAVTTLNFIGGLDRCNETLVRGWACNPNLPRRAQVVDVFLNDRFVGSARCDRRRDDLARLRPDLADSGFLFKFPKTVFLPESADTVVSVRYHNTERELAFSPWWLCRAVRLPDPAGAVDAIATEARSVAR